MCYFVVCNCVAFCVLDVSFVVSVFGIADHTKETHNKNIQNKQTANKTQCCFVCVCFVSVCFVSVFVCLFVFVLRCFLCL